MEMKQWLMLPFALLLTLTVSAQQENVLQQINDIKMRASAEGFLTDQQMTDMSEDSAVVWCASGILRQLGGGYTMDDIRPHLRHLVMPRGEKRLVFVYLKKDELGKPSSTPVHHEAPKGQVQLKHDIIDGKLVKNDSNRPKGTHEADGANKPNKPEEANRPQEDHKAPSAADRVKWMSGQMMSLPDVKTVARYLKDMQQTGRIAGYGAFGKAADINSCYVILFTKEEPHKPIGILTPVVDGRRTNVQTGEEDSVEAHSGCGAVWFTM